MAVADPSQPTYSLSLFTGVWSPVLTMEGWVRLIMVLGKDILVVLPLVVQGNN